MLGLVGILNGRGGSKLIWFGGLLYWFVFLLGFGSFSR